MGGSSEEIDGSVIWRTGPLESGQGRHRCYTRLQIPVLPGGFPDVLRPTVKYSLPSSYWVGPRVSALKDVSDPALV